MKEEDLFHAYCTFSPLSPVYWPCACALFLFFFFGGGETTKKPIKSKPHWGTPCDF